MKQIKTKRDHNFLSPKNVPLSQSYFIRQYNFNHNSKFASRRTTFPCYQKFNNPVNSFQVLFSVSIPSSGSWSFSTLVSSHTGLLVMGLTPTYECTIVQDLSKKQNASSQQQALATGNNKSVKISNNNANYFDPIWAHFSAPHGVGFQVQKWFCDCEMKCWLKLTYCFIFHQSWRNYEQQQGRGTKNVHEVYNEWDSWDWSQQKKKMIESINLWIRRLEQKK